jgi:hypothetical protein
MRMVVNTRRPFTADVAGILSMKDMMERTSGLKVTQLVCNTNLMEFTDAAIVREGLAIVREAAQTAELPFTEYLVLHGFEDRVPDDLDGLKRTILHHYLLKPWESNRD